MNFSEQFPLLASCTYLNTANSGLLSRSLLDWRSQHDAEFLEQGSRFRLHKDAFLSGVKETIAQYFHANAAYTFLVPNFSFGFNTVLDGLPGKQRFLLLTGDYPSVMYPVISRGFEYHQLAIQGTLEEDLLQAIETYKPTVLACSVVQYTSGMLVTQELITTIKSKYPDLLIIMDGTQYCGTAHLNFEQSGIDILLTSGYKWLLGGYGNGFVLMKAAAASGLYQQAQQQPTPKEAFLQNKSIVSLQFEPGHQDTLTYGSLQQSVLYLQQLGHSFIEDRIAQLTGRMRDALLERGLLNRNISLQQQAPLFTIPATDKLLMAIREANIICTERGGGLRVSFHFFNTIEEVGKLLDVLDSAL